jgi:hypothetical protein
MKIKIGDNVKVYLLNGNSFVGTVQRYACQTGECWEIEESNKTIHYVQTFQQIVKYPPHPIDNDVPF